MIAPFSKFYDKIWIGFYLKVARVVNLKLVFTD